jgi:hypothetical protein
LKKDRDAFERKVAALKRKNEKLQAKLDAAKAAAAEAPAPVPVPAVVPPPAPSSSRSPIPSSSNPVVPSLSQAIAPSASRPSAPSAPILAPAILDDHRSSPTSSTNAVGKKRPLPADFEECDNIPPQAFTPDSMPLTATPHARNVHQAHRGFTPVRHRALQPDRSPLRPPVAAPILDVTNSPRHGSRTGLPVEAKKRGWLPKPRGPDASVPRAHRP